jgi:photosystem II stability/assembly factor-like uncharacterized protein
MRKCNERFREACWPVKIVCLLVTLCFSAPSAVAQTAQQVPYKWKSVQIAGGGFVDGIIFHPGAPAVSYARTDIGGAYRWDKSTHRWQPLLDWIGYKDANLMGVESIAVDASDSRRVYLACGTYTNPRAPDAAVLRSDDEGQTFQRADLPFKLGGNEDGRGNGERLMVDPRDGRILYLGTPRNGLWRSADGGVSWAQVASFPVRGSQVVPAAGAEGWPARRNNADGAGVVFIKFDPSAAQQSSSAPTLTIYVGVSRMNAANLFVSHDGGATWSAVPGEPTQYRPTRAALSSDGFLYIAYGTSPGPSHMRDGALWKLNTRTGAWADLTPEKPLAGGREFGYAAVSVDAHHPKTLIASSFGRPASEGGDNIFRSTDGGATWTPIFGGSKGGLFDYRLAPYVKSTPIHWLFDIEIDPTDSNHAVFTTGYGGWETHDLTDADRGLPTHWTILATGIEETVALALLSPSRGAHLISAIGDYGGFVHWELDRPAPAGSSSPPRMANTTSLADAALRPRVVVRAGVDAAQVSGTDFSYSLDAGRNWAPAPASPTPNSRAGSVAVSADGATWEWTPRGEPAYFTRDRGARWTTARGLPANLRVIADPVAPRVFYAVSLQDSKLYISSDGGRTFSSRAFLLPGQSAGLQPGSGGDPRGGENNIYAAPGKRGDLWLPMVDGLYHVSEVASPNGLEFTHLPGVEQIEAFGFGRAAAGAAYPTLYLAGTVDDQYGVFRSTDEARTWRRINDEAHQWGLILQITGDPRIFGRVYIGTHGRGIIYGDPASH